MLNQKYPNSTKKNLANTAYNTKKKPDPVQTLTTWDLISIHTDPSHT
jgi:hypothetical protein